MLKQPKYLSIVPSSLIKRKDPNRSSSTKKEIYQTYSKSRLNNSILLPTLPTSHQSIPKRGVKLSPLSAVLNDFSFSPKSNSSFLKSHKASRSNNPSLQLSPKFNKKVEIVSIKKAMRNREWLIKSKEVINKEISSVINESNGIYMSPDEACYKCYLGKGNNSALVKQILASRWWWTCVDESELPNVNLVWTQGTCVDFLKTITMTKYKPEQPVPYPKKSLDCQVTFETETLGKLQVDLRPLGFDLVSQSESFLRFKDLKKHSSRFYRSHNKLEDNQVITDKKNLCEVMKEFYEKTGKEPAVPLTFALDSVDSEEFIRFRKYHESFEVYSKVPLWIVKPGENSNRGNGIYVTSDLGKIIETVKSNSSCFIVQKYIDRPFLIHKRKFDIRLYTLMTSVNGVFQCYYYNEGYLRTSCKEFTTKNLSNNFIHLTNDAIQKHADDYGKYENGNKLSYTDFQRYLDSHYAERHFFKEILPEIKEIVKDSVKASYLKIDPCRRTHSFEIMGYDFMLDADLKPWLIEINTNPCLELSSTILVRIIPAMVENVMRIALDTVFPEPLNIPKRTQGGFVQEVIQENKFELIFHEFVDGKDAEGENED